jgi:phosphoglycerol transferase MdoB-like AlkP superfamily enzyme
MYFTLSCHDPFDVPYKLRPARTEEEKFLNATMWVDKCLGAFIDRSKHSSWWKHTLVIISADHGSALPWHDKNYESRRYHIPILFTGGAVKLKDTVFHAYCSQTDLPYSLLKQLHIEPAKPYFFSHNMFSVEKGFALYIFNNGFGFVSDSSDMAFDCNSKKTIYSQTGKNSLTVNAGKAYMQEVYTRFLSTKK